MGEFTSPWFTWMPREPDAEKDTGGRGTAKTDKSLPEGTFVSFGSASRWLNRPAHAELTDDDRRRLHAEADGGDQLAQLVLQAVACTPDPIAWRLYSRRLDRELWLARDTEAAAALDADGARAGLPVVLADDLERLRDFDDHQLNDLLDVLIHFPGARIADLDPEAAS